MKYKENLILKTVSGPSLHNLSCACFAPGLKSTLDKKYKKNHLKGFPKKSNLDSS